MHGIQPALGSGKVIDGGHAGRGIEVGDDVDVDHRGEPPFVIVMRAAASIASMSGSAKRTLPSILKCGRPNFSRRLIVAVESRQRRAKSRRVKNRNESSCIPRVKLFEMGAILPCGCSEMPTAHWSDKFGGCCEMLPLQRDAGQWPELTAEKLRQKVFLTFFGGAIRPRKCAYRLPLAERAVNKVGVIVNTG